MIKNIINNDFSDCVVVTAGSAYLDIDAYACMVATAELLELSGIKSVAFSEAPCNYSVCKFLKEEGQITDIFPSDTDAQNVGYIIVDVSDPEFLKKSVPLDNVIAVYDHHVGSEDYWADRIAGNSHIEFIGAAATLIYREWKSCGLQDKMKRSTALLLIAAILDNTLNLTSSNTAAEDIEVFNELCEKENIGKEWCALYFSEVQKNVESDLKNAIFNDIKAVSDNEILPERVAQLCVWNVKSILERLSEIRQWFAESGEGWMINVIDINHQCNYFICDDINRQRQIERIFSVCFEAGVAKTQVSYLRKELIKKTLNSED